MGKENYLDHSQLDHPESNTIEHFESVDPVLPYNSFFLFKYFFIFRAIYNVVKYC